MATAKMSRFGRLFGVSEALLPRTYPDFEAYMRRTDQPEVLWVGPEARTLARDILCAGFAGLVWPFGALTDVLTAGLLPPGCATPIG